MNGFVGVWIRGQGRAGVCGRRRPSRGPVSPAMGALLLWHWGLRQRTWDMVAEHYRAKRRNEQAASRCLAEVL